MRSVVITSAHNCDLSRSIKRSSVIPASYLLSPGWLRQRLFAPASVCSFDPSLVRLVHPPWDFQSRSIRFLAHARHSGIDWQSLIRAPPGSIVAPIVTPSRCIRFHPVISRFLGKIARSRARFLPVACCDRFSVILLRTLGRSEVRNASEKNAIRRFSSICVG